MRAEAFPPTAPLPPDQICCPGLRVACFVPALCDAVRAPMPVTHEQLRKPVSLCTGMKGDRDQLVILDRVC